MVNDENKMLSNKVLVVTGGSGAIGSAICRAGAAHGATVAFTYQKNADQAQKLAAELERQGTQCLSGRVDGCNGTEINGFIEKVEESFERVDVLVNNLGTSQILPFALIEESDWDEVIQVNLKSMFLFSKAALRGMIRRKDGIVINIGSIAGHRLLEVPVHYATTKAAVSGFTLSLAKEMSRYGIRVNSVVPGLIEGGVGSQASERQLEDYNRFCALKRPGTPDEVAEVVAFLASNHSAYVNAQNIIVDGGL